MPERHLTCVARSADDVVQSLPCPICDAPRELSRRVEFGPIAIIYWRCVYCGAEGSSELELKERDVA